MYLYNISIISEESVHQAVATWLKENIRLNNEFEARFLELLNSPHEGITYCIQLAADSENKIQAFQEVFIAPLQALISQPSFHGKAFIFDSTMRYID